MIISDELFFSDWLVLKVYGGIPALPEQDLAEILIRARRGTPAGEGRTGGFSVISGDGLSGSATDIYQSEAADELYEPVDTPGDTGMWSERGPVTFVSGSLLWMGKVVSAV